MTPTPALRFPSPPEECPPTVIDAVTRMATPHTRCHACGERLRQPDGASVHQVTIPAEDGATLHEFTYTHRGCASPSYKRDATVSTEPSQVMAYALVGAGSGAPLVAVTPDADRPVWRQPGANDPAGTRWEPLIAHLLREQGWVSPTGAEAPPQGAGWVRVDGDLLTCVTPMGDLHLSVEARWRAAAAGRDTVPVLACTDWPATMLAASTGDGQAWSVLASSGTLAACVPVLPDTTAAGTDDMLGRGDHRRPLRHHVRYSAKDAVRHGPASAPAETPEEGDHGLP